ncbi:patatin-like phospholipase family protein [Reichenbachiella carrageenanivorans]|uniref:Patatin-like phospholipase family protein n=1 Tax=Reichenbachiella carrageenanivorans TaxID=2979869 RepID=A0ABY6CVL5_9BACT|nr:patatin-like phospholipase family protein [Reichenbachiella carrageenanivorans]UXX77951.1 patatin-like phospholipase family protein [Reichenbachiella carrageenanivorans]
MQSNKKTVSLVLGSGGARGLAHIGVIRWLQENDYEIKSISSCSIGSVIGGAYALGKLEILEEWMCSITKSDIVSLLDISWDGSGLFKGDKMIDTLINLIGNVKIEDLPIPYTAVAAAIDTEKEIWLNSGSLFDAIRASVSLPLFFTPVDYNGIKLIDGGVLNPVPIAPTFGDNTDLTIAVNLGGPPINITNEFTSSKAISPFQNRITGFVDSLKLKSTVVTEQSWSMYTIADKAFDAMQSTIARQKLAAYPPDIEIVIPRNICGTLDFDRSAEMIAYGYKKAKEYASEAKQ